MNQPSWAAGYLALCAIVWSVPSHGAEGAKSPFSLVDVRTSEGNFVQVVRAHAAKAQALGLKPFVYLWADWCPPCVALRRAVKTDSGMQDAFAGTYIIQLNVDRWGRQYKRTPLSRFPIPFFYEVTAEGIATGRKIDGNAWGKNTAKNMAPPLKAFFSAGSPAPRSASEALPATVAPSEERGPSG